MTAVAPAADAFDHWDIGGDRGITTGNVLLHGSQQVHELNTPVVIDEDWYLLLATQYSSYEVRVDGMTGDLDLTPADVQRMGAEGTQVLQNALVTDAGGVLSLAWTHGATLSDTRSFVKVRGRTCPPPCASPATYRIRFYDTTYTLPRFDNTGTRTTTLLVQNATDRACVVRYTFLRESGEVWYTADPVTLPPRGLDVHQSADFLPGMSGSARVAHTCGYGGLSGKAVSVETSTGFTFDTELEHRPH